MAKHRNTIMLFIVMINVAALIYIIQLPIPANERAETYYPQFLYFQFLVDMGLGLISGCVKEWKIALTFGTMSLLPLVVFGSA